jgi:hypothetical protein
MSITYEDWLKMSPEEQEHLHFKVWDVYQRDGYPIAVMAAARFAMQSGMKILHTDIGTWHGGEYILHMYVTDEELPKLPKPLEQVFEGFRIYWMSFGSNDATLDRKGSLNGIWKRTGGPQILEINVETRYRPIGVTIKTKSDTAPVSVSRVDLRENTLHFEVSDPQTGLSEQHQLRCLESDQCEHTVSTSETLYRGEF